MGNNCSNCSEKRYDPCSDRCDSCRNDSDVGWGGFVDHSIDQHFYSEEERQEYIKKEEENSESSGFDKWDW